ncbi:putative RNA methyltransferase [Gordonia phosphorivorans]|uniref:putative RNA methyltransferase n=1 Tax=Gordonia phosphorivorans TaxID=1056982 RepID=UPI003620CB41
MRCPVCSAALDIVEQGLRCAHAHRFDRARQGYVALLSGRGNRHRSDTATMVAARRRLLGAGLFDPMARALARRIPPEAAVIVDAGAGTGHYLAAALDAAPAAVGIGLDLSKYCARAVARAHPRAIAVVADLWEPVPVADAVADAVLSVFAPRNVPETARMLAPGGSWLLVTPNPGHLHRVRADLGMLEIGADKLERLHEELTAGGLHVRHTESVTAQAPLDAGLLADLAGMGPAGFHRTDDELRHAARVLTADRATIDVGIDVTVTVAAATPA